MNHSTTVHTYSIRWMLEFRRTERAYNRRWVCPADIRCYGRCLGEYVTCSHNSDEEMGMVEQCEK